jgi:hypothetical protein
MKTALLVLALMLVAGCAGTGSDAMTADHGEKPALAAAQHPGVCVARSDVAAIEPVDDYRVVLLAKDRRNAYLAAFADGCFNLEGESGFTLLDGDGDGQICGSGKDLLAYRRIRTLQKCRITDLQPFTDELRQKLGVKQAPASK